MCSVTRHQLQDVRREVQLVVRGAKSWGGSEFKRPQAATFGWRHWLFVLLLLLLLSMSLWLLLSMSLSLSGCRAELSRFDSFFQWQPPCQYHSPAFCSSLQTFSAALNANHPHISLHHDGQNRDGEQKGQREVEPVLLCPSLFRTLRDQHRFGHGLVRLDMMAKLSNA